MFHNKIKPSEWIESLVITVILIIVSLYVDDPLSLNSPYPWIWFGPVLIALRYGLIQSQCSIFLLLLAYLYQAPTQLYVFDFQLFILGGFLLTMICAIWQNSWEKKILYSNEIAHYLEKRIQTIANAYKLSNLAYKRLENNYIAKPVTIRTSMFELREMRENIDGKSEKDILDRLLNILTIHCSLEKAAIFPVKNNQIILEPLASIGATKEPAKGDFFVKQCLGNATLTYANAEEIIKGNFSDYLVGCPLIDENNKIYALLLVEELSFLSLNDENMTTMNLLVEYYIQGKTVKNADLILKAFPDCPIPFANELQRLIHLERKTKKDSALQVFKMTDTSHAEDYIFRLKQEIRGLDSWWITQNNSTKFFMVLMPFTNREAAEHYKMRIDKLLTNEYNVSLNQNGMIFNSYQISSITDPIRLIEVLLKTK